MILDFAEICRLCGKSGELSYVFEENELWNKIFICIGVKIQKEDKITQQICKSCYFFTNTVHEFRLSSLKHDTDLREAYLLAKSKVSDEDLVKEKTSITYPSEETSISQESFLITFNLKHKNRHSSIISLKRKFPLVNIPKEWCELDIDPKVRIDLREYNNYVSKKVKTTENLGISSGHNKLSGKYQSDLVFARVKSIHETSSNSDVSEVSKRQNKKLSPRRRRRAQKKKVVKKILPPKIRQEENDNLNYKSDSVSTHSALEQDRNVLKNLLHTDSLLDSSSSARPKGEDFGNLLISVGEEVKTYICQTCNRIFDTQSSLTNHKKFKHKPSLRCTICSQSFNIVENLVKHNATCHPETVASTSQTENKINETQEEKSVDSAHKSFARKRTGGTPQKPIVNDSVSDPKIAVVLEPEGKTDCDAYVISSDDDDDDDDVQITNVTDNSNNNTNADMDSIINAVLEPQKMTESEKCIIENTVNVQVTKISQSAVNDVLLITDSDEEKNNSNEKPRPKLAAVKSDFVPTKPKLTPSTSQLQPSEINHASDSDSSLSFDITQKIVVVPSAEDKEHMDATSNASENITNELSYINYIFSKCNFAAGNKKGAKKWLLKDVHKFTKNTILPIEIIRSNSNEVKIEYGRDSLEKLSSKGPFWNSSGAIGIDKLPSIITKENRASTSATITQTAAYTSQSVLKSNINTPTPNIQSSSTKTISLVPTKPSTPSVRVNTTSAVAITQSRTVPIESVTKVGPGILQNQISVASGSSTNNLSPSAAIQNRVKTYGRIYKPISPQHGLPVNPNPSEQKQPERKQTQGTFLVPNGYILMGVSTDKNKLNQNEDGKSKPILLNGMPFSSLTNMRNPNPQMVLQPQHPNVNIQNCINIWHQEVSANTQQQYASITVPVMAPGQNEQPIHQSIQPAQSQVIQPVMAPVQSIDSNGSNGFRPAIRIKNLSELTGKNTKPSQRNELHNMYTTALSNYIQTNTTTASAIQSENIQIS